MRLKKVTCIAMCIGLCLANVFISNAEYENGETYDANVSYNQQLYTKLERCQSDLASLEQDIDKYQAEVDEYKEAYEALEDDYNAEINKSGVKDMDLITKYKEAKSKYNSALNYLNSSKQSYTETQHKIDSIQELMANSSEKYLSVSRDNAQTSAEDDAEDAKYNANLTNSIFITNQDGTWLLYAPYRSWNKLMGGQWEYNAVINENVVINLYDGGTCLESALSRADSYDTDNTLYWYIKSDLTNGKKYYVELNGSKFSVTAHTSGNNASSSSTENTDTTGNSHSEDMMLGDSSTPVIKDYSINIETSIEDNTGAWERREDGSWKFRKSDGNYAVNEYVKVNNIWYAFDNNALMYDYSWLTTPDNTKYFCNLDGGMAKGWALINGSWYYFYDNNSLAKGTVTPDGYTVDENGKWVN
jgi:hypothetical protein